MYAVQRLFLAFLLAAAGVIVMLSPAHALDCVGPPDRLVASRSAFTGRIIDSDHAGPRTNTASSGARILVDVQEIWSGEPVHDPIWLDTELDGWWDVERGGFPDGYSSDKTWLFMPSTEQRSAPTVNPCIAWPSTRPGSHSLRPAQVRVSIEDHAAADAAATPATATAGISPEDDDTSAWTLGGIAAAVGAGLVGIAIRSRRRTG